VTTGGRASHRSDGASEWAGHDRSGSRTKWWRALVLVLALGSATALIATLSVRGLGYINLDSLVDEPIAFCACIMIPAALSLGALLALILPRTVSINIAVLASLLVVAEVAAWTLRPAAPPVLGKPEPAGKHTFRVRDAALGYALTPSITARHRRTRGNDVLYDVTYEIDEHGRRRTPVDHGELRTSFLVFFGDSNTFGEGLTQTETLPYFAGKLAPQYRPYNYGVSGWGPAQLYALARRPDLVREIDERDGYAIFFLIPAHVARVIGSTRVSAR
jgi:hypothetical protein